jgi:exonuclease III
MYGLMEADKLRLLCSNVRGLNNPARRDAVRDLVRDAKASIVCLQETKLQTVDKQLIVDSVGASFADDFAFLPADGMRGGVILAVSSSFFSLSNATTTSNTISATITNREDGSS